MGSRLIRVRSNLAACKVARRKLRVHFPHLSGMGWGIPKSSCPGLKPMVKTPPPLAARATAARNGEPVAPPTPNRVKRTIPSPVNELERLDQSLLKRLTICPDLMNGAIGNNPFSLNYREDVVSLPHNRLAQHPTSTRIGRSRQIFLQQHFPLPVFSLAILHRCFPDSGLFIAACNRIFRHWDLFPPFSASIFRNGDLTNTISLGNSHLRAIPRHTDS